MHELELEAKETKPELRTVGVKADCLVFNNVTTYPPTLTRGVVLKGATYLWISNALSAKNKK
eukprot:12120493-Alexandrium_andersonii.AAC.1